MKTAPECHACLQGLARRAAAEASADGVADPSMEAELLEQLERTFRVGREVPTRLATDFLRALRERTGNPDPFRDWKEREYRAACRAAEALGAKLPDTLEAKVRFSVLGNRLDFFRELETVEREWREPPVALARDDTDALLAALAARGAGGTLLFLTDNAGEVPFDRPLIEELRTRGHRVIVAVKGAPSQNDLARDDVERWGLELGERTDTGSDRVGCELDSAGAPFQRAWGEADAVLAKGMANLETLTEYPEALARKPVFFLLIAKCPPVARFVGVRQGEAALVCFTSLPAPGRNAFHEPDSPERVPVDKHLRVGAAWAGMRLFDAVRRGFPEVGPRALFAKARAGEILLNGQPADPRAFLQEEDLIRVTLYRPPRPTEKPVLLADTRVATPAGPLWIIREDEDLLAVSKPPGCASHPALAHSGDTLVERVRHHLGAADGFAPALANRLDIPTSGIVLVGKNPHARRKLGFYLQRGRVEKRYLALVKGWPERDAGEIELPLERLPDSRELEQYPPGHPRREVRLQRALTRYRVVERAERPVRAALLEVELLTGRYHQIRRHLAAVGHPVALDRRYGDEEFNEKIAEASGVERLFLHAHFAALPHPATGRRLELWARLPDDLREGVQSLGFEADAPEGALSPLRPAPGPPTGR